MLNFNKNDLINDVLSEYYKTFSLTLDTADFVPEKYNSKISRYIFKNLKKMFRKIDKEDKRFQRELIKENKSKIKQDKKIKRQENKKVKQEQKLKKKQANKDANLSVK